MSREVWVVERKAAGGWEPWVSFDMADAEKTARYVASGNPDTRRARRYFPAPDREPKADDGLRERLRYVLPSRFQSEYTLKKKPDWAWRQAGRCLGKRLADFRFCSCTDKDRWHRIARALRAAYRKGRKDGHRAGLCSVVENWKGSGWLEEK